MDRLIEQSAREIKVLTDLQDACLQPSGHTNWTLTMPTGALIQLTEP